MCSLDDWGLAPLTDADRRELLEILEDRYELRSTLVTSQLPVEKWYEALGWQQCATLFCFGRDGLSGRRFAPSFIDPF